MKPVYLVMTDDRRWCRANSIVSAKIGAKAKRGVKYVLFRCSDPKASVDGIGCVAAAAGSTVENLGTYVSRSLDGDDDKAADARAKTTQAGL